MQSVSEGKANVREAFRRFASTFYQQEFGKIAPKQLHEGLLRFYVSEIYNKLFQPISEDEFNDGCVDMAGDVGVDFIHRDDGTVLILQAKHRGAKGLVELDEILHFKTVFDRLVNGDFKKNSKLAEILADVDFEHDRFVLKFVSLARLAGQAELESKSEPRYPIEDMASRAEFHFLAEDELTLEFRDALSLARGVTGTVELHAAGKRNDKHAIIELPHPEFPSVAMVVKAGQLISLFNTYKSALFTLNIRNYLGNTATNQGILKTLKTEPAQFYYRNNGVACLAEEVKVRDGSVVVTNLQVINGAQTVRSLHKASKDRANGQSVNDALVFIRVTQAESQYGVAGRFRDSVVRANNTQNVIKLSDFKSNDPIQEDLRRQFAEVRRFGKQVCYIPKRTDPKQNGGSFIIPMEEFAKVSYAFLHDPVSFSAKTSFLFDEGKNGAYAKVFGDGTEVYTAMPVEEFKLRSAIWWLSDEFAKRLKIDRENAPSALAKAALERKWFLLYVARLVLERSFRGEPFKTELRKHYRGEWWMGEPGAGEWFERLYNVSKQGLTYRYSEASAQASFVHRNWMRSMDSVKMLADYARLAPGMEI